MKLSWCSDLKVSGLRGLEVAFEDVALVYLAVVLLLDVFDVLLPFLAAPDLLVGTYQALPTHAPPVLNPLRKRDVEEIPINSEKVNWNYIMKH